MVIGFLNAHNLNTVEVEDSEYLDNLISNFEEEIDYEGGDEWRGEMVKEYRKYFFKKRLESLN